MITGKTQPAGDGEFIARAGNIDARCTAHQTERLLINEYSRSMTSILRPVFFLDPDDMF
jgi:hypothetical protein